MADKFDPVKVFKALADPTRMQIVACLAQKGEMSCASLSEKFNLSQPTLCHHFGKLIAAGILNIRKEGVVNYYHLNQHAFRQVGIEYKKLALLQ